MKNILSWLRSPHFKDEDDDKRAATLYPIIQVMVVIYIVLSIFTGLKQQFIQFYILQLIGVTLILNLFLVRRKKFKIPGYIIPTSLLLGVTIVIFNGQGVHDVAMLSFPMIIALSGLLIGKGAAIYSAIGGVACVAILIHAEMNNLLSSDFQSYTDYGDLLIIGTLLIATAAVVYTTMDIISKHLIELKRLNDELEERVAERTVELENTNKDLESFAYSISHDLRAPLRSIGGYSHILLDDFSESLDEAGKHYLQNIYENVKQMNTLIDEILALSRTGRQELEPRNLSSQELKEMLQGILNGLIALEEVRQVEITLGDLPDCFADPVLLKQAYVNLLSNAFKFTRHCPKAQIEIGCQLEDKLPVYYVHDNGAGFDMAYADKLFGVFQRLHRQDEYEGTGVGLAIVHRIITRHNGKIWATSAPNQGATFYFTLNMNKTRPRAKLE
ncbi:MAG: two-component sensor histidine kinase [Chloroflexi bacterium HGW-Chloroflexi-6]|nr:MAG: two-component sensor histidine kinase [Chloroflexi bacterium HGW-Chloroflexi-6]